MSRRKIAAIVTTYFPGSHADLLVSRFVKGFPTPSGVVEPDVDVVSMYIDQAHPQDVGVALARDHGIELFPSIRSALALIQPPRGHWPTAPGWEVGEMAVDGVLIIGEHGDYAPNERGRQMYPRKYFFEQVCGMIGLSGRAVPVFNDKHLAYSWDDARWMYDRAAELGIPFLAGSSLPVTGPDTGAGARGRRAYRRGPVARPLPRLSERPRLLRLPRPGGPPVHGRAAARRRDGHRRGPVHRGPGRMGSRRAGPVAEGPGRRGGVAHL